MTIRVTPGTNREAIEEWPFSFQRGESTVNLVLVMRAKNVRQEPTGPHAFIGIELREPTSGKRLPLVGNDFNVVRGDKQTWLANQAAKQGRELLPGIEASQDLQPSTLRTRVTYFCDGLWDAWNGMLRSDLMDADPDHEPAQFLLRPYILDRAITFLYGQGGHGKSYVAQMIGLALDAAGEGCQLPWPIESPVHTCYVNLERSEAQWRARLARCNVVAGLHPRRPFRLIQARGRSLPDVLDAMHHDVADNGVRCFILDSVTRAGMGDLTKNDVANRIVDTFGAIAEAGASILGIGHTSWEGEHMYGAVQFLQGADVMVKQTGQQDVGGALTVKLEVDKVNDNGKGFSELFSLAFQGPDLIRFDRLGRDDMPAELRDMKRLSVAQAVLLVLEEAGDDPVSPADIAKAAEKPPTAVVAELRRLVNLDRVTKVTPSGKGKSLGYILRDAALASSE